MHGPDDGSTMASLARVFCRRRCAGNDAGRFPDRIAERAGNAAIERVSLHYVALFDLEILAFDGAEMVRRPDRMVQGDCREVAEVAHGTPAPRNRTLARPQSESSAG